MNKEEIEELKEFTIDLTDIDELALGLEICSKKSNMVIQEFIDTIFQLQQENQKHKEVIEKAIEYIDDWLFNVGGMGACMDYKDIKEILDILKGGENE